MYRFSKDIRIRICGEITFFVNIKNNSIFKVNTNALQYLKDFLNEGSSIDSKNSRQHEFQNFVDYLQNIGVLETVEK